MGTRIIKVSERLITDVLTTGYQVGQIAVVTCSEGLLKGARLVSVVLKPATPTTEQIIIAIFEHPDWKGNDVLTPTFTLAAHEDQPAREGGQ